MFDPTLTQPWRPSPGLFFRTKGLRRIAAGLAGFDLNQSAAAPGLSTTECGDEEALRMNKLSARNQIQGRIVDVAAGLTTAHVRIDVGGGTIITASITNEAVAELDLKPGIDAWAVIKASDVMIGV
jgi:molybdopterin-binding protein